MEMPKLKLILLCSMGYSLVMSVLLVNINIIQNVLGMSLSYE